MAKSTGTKKDLAKMSIEDLEERAQALDEEYAAIRDEKQLVQEILSEKVIEQQALARLETMSDAEKAVLVQHIKAEGIKSEEKVGTPGN